MLRMEDLSRRSSSSRLLVYLIIIVYLLYLAGVTPGSSSHIVLSLYSIGILSLSSIIMVFQLTHEQQLLFLDGLAIVVRWLADDDDADNNAEAASSQQHQQRPNSELVDDAVKRAKEAEQLAATKTAEAEAKVALADAQVKEKEAEHAKIAGEKAAALHASEEERKDVTQQLNQAQAECAALIQRLEDAGLVTTKKVWECWVGTVYIPYPKSVCNILDAKYAELKNMAGLPPLNDRRVAFCLDKKKYYVEFRGKETFVQENPTTGYRRQVRYRDDVIIPKSPDRIVWECQLINNWVPYTRDVSAKLEAGFVEKKKVGFSISDIDYEVDCCAAQLKQMNVTTKFTRSVRRRELYADDDGFEGGVPPTWDVQDGEQHLACKLVDVPQASHEWRRIAENLQRSLPTASIINIQRVQNKRLWDYFLFHKARIMQHTADPNVVQVWHGTRGTQPIEICQDQHDGFMIQRSKEGGSWGHGIYFAVNASYSDQIAYRCSSSGCSKLILARLVAGEEVHLPADKSLRMCPEMPGTKKRRYNTVTSTTGGSNVHIVYENGRAYPEYLVSYKKN